MDFNKHVSCFLKLIDDHHITAFFQRDACGALCDKYHLVIIFQFFMRAEFKEEDYTVRNFFLALTLSHDLYDESKVLKHIIMLYYLSRHEGASYQTKTTFQWDKLLLFERMQFRGFIEKKICQRLCRLIQHRAFYKNRKELHTGITRFNVLCAKCKCPTNGSQHSSRSSREKSEKSRTRDTEECNIAKKPRRESSEASLFFLDSESDCLSDEKNISTSVC